MEPMLRSFRIRHKDAHITWPRVTGESSSVSWRGNSINSEPSRRDRWFFIFLLSCEFFWQIRSASAHPSMPSSRPLYLQWSDLMQLDHAGFVMETRSRSPRLVTSTFWLGSSPYRLLLDCGDTDCAYGFALLSDKNN
jgi:hypothetical protein